MSRVNVCYYRITNPDWHCDLHHTFIINLSSGRHYDTFKESLRRENMINVWMEDVVSRIVNLLLNNPYLVTRDTKIWLIRLQKIFASRWFFTRFNWLISENPYGTITPSLFKSIIAISSFKCYDWNSILRYPSIVVDMSDDQNSVDYLCNYHNDIFWKDPFRSTLQYRRCHLLLAHRVFLTWIVVIYKSSVVIFLHNSTSTLSITK